MKKIKKLVWKLLRALGLSGIVALLENSYLKDKGWFRTHAQGLSVDNNKQTIPWFTYPFNRFITERLTPELTLFEYGCGNSTIWFSERVGSITSVEHNPEWHSLISPKLPSNASVILVSANEYAASILAMPHNYHIIIVDGVNRNECLEASAQKLLPNGVIILDNSEREEYAPAVHKLIQKGFKRLDFEGMAPVMSQTSQTTLFYKTDNCLGI